MTFRLASPMDADDLTWLEEVANLSALGHVFPPEEYPFPRDGVLARWQAVLADPGVTVELIEAAGGPVCFVAYDATTLRHLAVHPERWSTGLARLAVTRAAAAIRAAGHRPRLWCLADNQQAMGCYLHLGWALTGRERDAEWPPYPVECELVLEG
jgi:GNAT superfamily N-acetyltransferase